MSDDHLTGKKHVKERLDEELKHASVVNEPIKPLLERLFPQSKLPVSIQETFQSLQGMDYDNDRKIWANAPTVPGLTGIAENNFQNLLNRIISCAMATHPDARIQRVWSSDYSETPLKPAEDTGVLRKPDLIAINPVYLKYGVDLKKLALRWRDVDLFGEIKLGNVAKISDLYDDLAQKALCIFQSQWNRRFIIAISFLRRNCFISLFNRSGVIHSNIFDIHRNPKLFLHVVLSLTFSPASQIGFDTTFNLTDPKKPTINHRNKTYNIVQSVWKSYAIRGRGTQCFIVELNGRYFVIKDVHVARQRRPTEVYFYRKAAAANVRHMPKLLEWENVFIDGVKDACEVGTTGRLLEQRIHRRYLYGQCGVPIWNPLRACAAVVR